MQQSVANDRRHSEGRPTMTDATTTLADLREGMARFVAERDWQQFHAPKNLSMALAAEAAELMEHFLWIDNDASRELVRDPSRRGPIADELADVLGVVLALANALELDLSQAVASKMARNVLKYPADKVRGRYRLEEP
jgi:NTP pyrophosphatase (non-canonical NTP hydrolase)